MWLIEGELSALTVLLRFALASVLSGIIGIERSRHGSAAGLRTYIIVALGAAMTAMMGIFACRVLEFDSDPLRISAQVISGIGFLGVGTILIRGRNHVTGLTTAAGLWTTAATGIACGMGFYSAAIICSFFTFFVTVILTHVESRGSNGKNICRIYIECDDASMTNNVIESITNERYGLYGIEITPPRTGMANHLGIEAVIPLNKKSLGKDDVIRELSGISNVLFTVETV